LPAFVRVRQSFYVRYGKRLFDVTVACVALAVLAPFVLVVALLGQISIGSPVFFHQVRLGLYGQEFVMLKFRSMLPCRRLTTSPIGHEDRRGTHKSTKDPRHTRFGRILRKSSIDEIPQLLNVLKGDMSLVGPRPELPEIAARHNLVDHVRHTVRPGLTGLWQVSDDRPGFVHENVRYDVEYLNTVSLRTDLTIIFKTIPVLLRFGGL
jgi:lipopolysaccharide/colanic/teichoic acid biosynthesis glycosyltransferase